MPGVRMRGRDASADSSVEEQVVVVPWATLAVEEAGVVVWLELEWSLELELELVPGEEEERRRPTSLLMAPVPLVGM